MKTRIFLILSFSLLGLATVALLALDRDSSDDPKDALIVDGDAAYGRDYRLPDAKPIGAEGGGDVRTGSQPHDPTIGVYTGRTEFPDPAVGGRGVPQGYPGNNERPYYEPMPSEQSDQPEVSGMEDILAGVLGDVIFGDGDLSGIEGEILNRAPEILGGMIGEGKQIDPAEIEQEVAVAIDNLKDHPIGQHAPEIIGAILNGEQPELDPVVIDQVLTDAPAVINGMLEEVERENPVAVRVGRAIFERILSEQ